MLRLLQALTRRKRAFERLARRDGLMLFSPSGYLGAAKGFDASEGGVGVVSACRRFDEVSHILDPARAMAFTVRLAWQSGDRAGFQYVKGTLLRGYVADPELAAVQKAWAEIAVVHGLVAPGGAFSRGS